MVQLRMSPGTPDYARHRQLLVRWQVTRLLQRCLLDAPLPLSHRAQQGKRLACTIGQGSQRSAPQSHCWTAQHLGWSTEQDTPNAAASPICHQRWQVSGCMRQAVTGQHLQASTALHGMELGLHISLNQIWGQPCASAAASSFCTPTLCCTIVMTILLLYHAQPCHTHNL